MSFSKNGLCEISAVLSRSLRNTLQNWNSTLNLEYAKQHSLFSKLSHIKVYLTELLVMWLVCKYSSQHFGLPYWGWRLASLPVCAATCRVIALSLSPVRTDLPNPKTPFSFSPPCTLSSFSSIISSQPPSLLLPVLVSLPLWQIFPLFFPHYLLPPRF